MTEPIAMTDADLDELIRSLGSRLGIVYDTEPLEYF